MTVSLPIGDGFSATLGADLVPNNPDFYIIDYDAQTFVSQAFSASLAFGPEVFDEVAPQNGAVLMLNPNNFDFEFAGFTYVDGVRSELEPGAFTPFSYGGFVDSRNVNGVELTRLNDATNDTLVRFLTDTIEMPDGGASFLVFFDGLDFVDAPPGEVNLDGVRLIVSPRAGEGSAVIAPDVVDPEGDAFTFTITGQPVNGSVSINGDGDFEYVSEIENLGEGQTVPNAFTFVATDAFGAESEEVTVNLNLLGVDGDTLV